MTETKYHGEARERIGLSPNRMGMGPLFESKMPPKFYMLKAWLPFDELSGNDWLMMINFIRGLIHRWIQNFLALLEGGLNLGHKVSLVIWVDSKDCISPLASSSLNLSLRLSVFPLHPFPGCHEVSRFPVPRTSALMFLPPHGPKINISWPRTEA